MKNFRSIACLSVLGLVFAGACASLNPSTVLRVPAQAATSTPLTDPAQLRSAVREGMYPLTEARIVVADYDLIRRDFPALASSSDPDIDRWLLDNTAFISKGQADQTVVNNSIPVDRSREVSAWRPYGYGRASVAQIDMPGHPPALIDIKGSGATKPQQRSHGNGLMSLGESFREYIYENLVRDGLRDIDSPVKTIGSYAVIDAGFNVVHADGSTSRAGLYLRQAAIRDNIGFDFGPNAVAVKKMLRSLGIETEENIQMTRGQDLIDFGHYYVSPKLHDELVARGEGRKLLPLSVWGHDPQWKASNDSWSRSRLDYPWAWSHEFAEAWARGEVNRDVAWRHFQTFKGSYRDILKPGRGLSGCSGAMGQLLGR